MSQSLDYVNGNTVNWRKCVILLVFISIICNLNFVESEPVHSLAACGLASKCLYVQIAKCHGVRLGGASYKKQAN